MSEQEKITGWAAYAVDVDGESWDLGGGWETESEALRDLSEQGADLSEVRCYPAWTDDEWLSWQRS